MDKISIFRESLVAANDIIDDEATHHLFASGMHGRKIDLDNSVKYI